MIPADKKPVLESAMAAYNRRLLRKHFHALWIAGEEHVRGVDRSVPTVLFGNHSCWWDPLVEFFVSHDLFGLDGYAMMEERQLERYRFFRWIGVFSVRRESPRDAVASLRYAASLLDRPNRALWIYPQGVMLPGDVRPLAFQTGIGRLAQMLGRVQFVPFAHRYEFVGDQRPEVFTEYGPSFIPDRSGDVRAVVRDSEERVTAMLDGLRSRISKREFGAFRNVLRGSPSTSTRWDRARLLEEAS
jgi:chlorobactene lauroyltransferase